jgi:hypothetical protein
MPRSGTLEDKPIKTLSTGTTGEKAILDIPRQQRSVASSGQTVNGNGDSGATHTNGTDMTSNKRKTDGTEEANGTTKKRPAPEASEDDGPSAKRSKVVQNGGPRADDDPIVLDDATDGAIVIDDD